MRDSPQKPARAQNHYHTSNLSRRINNPQIYNQDEQQKKYGFNINVIDPESQNQYPDEKYIKEMTGRTPASLSFFTKSTNTLVREVSHEFDQFAYTLIGFGLLGLLIGFCVLSCMSSSTSSS